MNSINSSLPRLYGRRKGRPLRSRKAQLLKELLPRLQILLPQLETDNRPASIDPILLFTPKPASLWLEIGFGGGEHLAAQAKANPDTGFIGCEPFINGVAGLLDHIEKNGSRNVRIFKDDARKLLDILPTLLFDRCFLLFPDPWPKARHAERRFIQAENIVRLARVLKPDAELQLATDDANLAIWMYDRMQESKEFRLNYNTSQPPENWVQTRYEQKGIKAGRQPVYMSWRRI